jgi:hypothetical protein
MIGHRALSRDTSAFLFDVDDNLTAIELAGLSSAEVRVPATP